MTRLMAFQEATVNVACEVLSAAAGPRRFLVADEVGLGKTVIAREIIRRLAQTSGQSRKGLTVFYFANSLGLTSQNGDSLAKLGAEGMQVARFKKDRLGLAATWQPDPTGAELRLFVFTPLTSLPGARSHSGTRKERALALAMAAITFPGMLRGATRDDILGVAASRHLVLEQLRELRRSFSSPVVQRNMKRGFTVALCLRLGLKVNSDDVRAWVKEWCALRELDPRKHRRQKRLLVDALRGALCGAALSRRDVCPDLVILDEFQKYRWLLQQESGIAGQIIGAGSDTATLLLSATPFEEHRQ